VDLKFNGTSNILGYSFGCFPMAFMMALHILGNKINSKENVKTGMGKIQKDTNKLTIQSSNYFKGSTYERQLESILKGRGFFFTIFHVKAMEKVTRILRLRKGNAFLRLQNLKTNKIMQVS
jgi:hypothetical protein